MDAKQFVWLEVSFAKLWVTLGHTHTHTHERKLAHDQNKNKDELGIHTKSFGPYRDTHTDHMVTDCYIAIIQI